MNASLLLGIVEHELGSSILARNRKVSLHDYRAGRVMLAEVLPAQKQEVAQVSHAKNKYGAKQRSQNKALDEGASISHSLERMPDRANENYLYDTKQLN